MWVSDVCRDGDFVWAERVKCFSKSSVAFIMGCKCITDDGNVVGFGFASVARFCELGGREGSKGAPTTLTESYQERSSCELEKLAKVCIDNCT
jgi:hypothetical protein